jgi:hypothetical protein
VVIGVLERPTAPDSDEPRVADLAQDHGAGLEPCHRGTSLGTRPW